MVKKDAFGKTVIRTYLRNKGRFLANFLTVLVSVFITAGLASLPITFTEAFSQHYIQGNAPDLIVKSKAYTGFDNEQLDQIAHYEGVQEVESFFTFDAMEDDGTYNRFVIIDFETNKIAKPTLLEGALPTTRGQIAMVKPNKNRKNYRLGEQLEFKALKAFVGPSATISAIIDSPLYQCVAKERAELEDIENKQYVQAIFYLDRDTIPSYMRDMRSDVYVRFASNHEYFSDTYYREMENAKTKVETLLGADEVAVLTLEETTSYGLYKNYNQKVSLIGYIFPAFFLVLCALINHITVTRLIKDERSSLAVYSSVGVDKKSIVAKYSIFIGASVFLGGIVGYLVGAPLLPKIIEPAYNAVFAMDSARISMLAPLGIATVVALTVIALIIAVYSSLMYLREEPSDLMRDKAPKPGKKILLERIRFLWNPLPFSFKSSFRNIFRQKKNLLLTSLAIGGSTLLVFLGFALLNVSDAMKEDELFSEVGSSMGLISTVIVLLAVGMALPVLYSLINMNIEDRRREIATLKVLGYHDLECSMYTFREIVIITILSLLIAVPLSALIADGVLRFLSFGSLQDVLWWTYVSAAGVVLVTTFGVNFMLYPKIRSIDMNASLKSVE